MQFWVNTVASASVLLLTALAFYPTLITNRAFVLSAAVGYPIGGYSYVVALRAGMPVILAIVFGVASSAVISGVLDWWYVRYLRIRGVPSTKVLVATLGIYGVLQNLISVLAGDDVTPLLRDEIATSIRVGDAHLSIVQAITIIAAILCSISLWWLLARTSAGRSIRAVASNPELAEIFGHGTERTRFIAAVVGGLLAGATGILVGLDTGVTPAMGFRLLLQGIVVILVAGLADASWLWISALAVAALQTTAVRYLGIAWMESAAYAVLILVLLWRPFGLGGRRLRKVEI